MLWDGGELSEAYCVWLGDRGRWEFSQLEESSPSQVGSGRARGGRMRGDMRLERGRDTERERERDKQTKRKREREREKSKRMKERKVKK